MRCPSAYCATSTGTSRSIIRSSTQPTCPDEVRTRYQSSITGGGWRRLSSSLVPCRGWLPSQPRLEVASGRVGCFDAVTCGCFLLCSYAACGSRRGTGLVGFGQVLGAVARLQDVELLAIFELVQMLAIARRRQVHVQFGPRGSVTLHRGVRIVLRQLLETVVDHPAAPGCAPRSILPGLCRSAPGESDAVSPELRRGRRS